MVRIAVIGTGYVGLVTGTCLAELGHEVTCADIDSEKINRLSSGESPIYEMGLTELLKKNLKEDRLKFTTDIDISIHEAQVVFSAVGTPSLENGEADLQYVKEVAHSFARNCGEYKLFVNKSTVPVGTGETIRRLIEETGLESGKFSMVSNPEFLREGAAVKDFLNPDRIVIGTEDERAKELMRQIYLPLERMQSPIMFTDVKSAELIKYASNAFLATKISFINEISRLCDKTGAEVKDVAKGMGMDKRIGPRFLQAGIGYGGSCFPKDVAALAQSAREYGSGSDILDAVQRVNRTQREWFYEKVEEALGELEGKTVTVWGLSFKPRTDDVRDAPSADVIRWLLDKGTTVQVFDPVAEWNYRSAYPDLAVTYCQNHFDACKGSDALLVLTEWDEFRTLDFERLSRELRGNVIIDGRNIYDGDELAAHGFIYYGMGHYS